MQYLCFLIGVSILVYTWNSSQDTFDEDRSTEYLTDLLRSSPEESDRLRLEREIELAAEDTRKLYTDIKYAIHYLTGSVFIVGSFLLNTNAGIRKRLTNNNRKENKSARDA